MKSKIKYLAYLLKHKWYVMIECFKAGLILQGLTHDLSKFTREEFIPYSNFFYGKTSYLYKKAKKKNGYCKPFITGDQEFDDAWLIHCKRNKHHWQWWVFPDEQGIVRAIPIDKKYLTEMLCDWVAAGKAQGHCSPQNDPYQNVREWYKCNKNKIQLAPNTREEIEKRIGYTDTK